MSQISEESLQKSKELESASAVKPSSVNPSESLAVQLATKDAEITALKIELDAKNAELDSLKKEVC